MKLLNVIDRDYINPVDLETLNNTINTLQTGHIEALDKANQIKIALSQFDLNEQEDEWKQNKVNEINSIIDENTIYGNAYAALDDIITEGTNMLTGPDLTGRVKAQEAYKAFQTDLDNRTDLSERDKEYFRENNKYYYQDKYDSNGNIIGGTKWTPNISPVEKKNVAESFVKAVSLAAKEAGGTGGVRYVDKNGNTVTDISQAEDFLIQNSSSKQWERLSEDKIQQAWNFMLQNEPGLKESFQQDYNIEKYYYDKAVKNGETYIGPYTNSNGIVYSNVEDFIQARIDPGKEAAKYYNSFTDYKQNIISLGSEKSGSGSGNAEDIDVLVQSEITGEGENLKYTKMFGADVINGLNSAKGNAIELYREIMGTKLKNYKNFSVEDWKNTFDEMENNILNSDKYDTITKQNMLYALDTQYRELKDNMLNYNDLKNQLAEDDKELFDFINATNASSELPIDNEYSKEFSKSINTVWNNNDYIRVDVNNYEDLQKELINNGIKCEIAKGNNRTFIKIPNTEKNKTLKIALLADKYNPYYSKSDNNPDKNKISILDFGGLNAIEVSGAMSTIKTKYNNLQSSLDRKISKLSNSIAVTTNNTGMKSISNEQIKKSYELGRITPTDFNTLSKTSDENLLRELTSASFNKSNIYIINKDNVYEELLDTKKINELALSLQTAIQSGKEPTVEIVTNDLMGASWRVTWLDNNNKIQTILSPNLMDDNGKISEYNNGYTAKTARQLTEMDASNMNYRYTLFSEDNSGIFNDIYLNSKKDNKGVFYLTVNNKEIALNKNDAKRVAVAANDLKEIKAKFNAIFKSSGINITDQQKSELNAQLNKITLELSALSNGMINQNEIISFINN